MTLLPLRVMVEDVWDEVFLEISDELPLSEVKRQALDMTRVKRDPSEYILKFRGAQVSDESVPIARAGLVPNGALIVLPRRRRPVR
jgi:hypothetical protein